MKRSQFSEKQITVILKEREAGLKVADPCRKHGVSNATFYKLLLAFGSGANPGPNGRPGMAGSMFQRRNGSGRWRVRTVASNDFSRMAMPDNAALKGNVGKKW